jgi:AcrR family transcriptional regulator
LTRTTRSQPAAAGFSESQIKIILAAEKLFAQTSIDSASLREIAVKAHLRNHFAVQYHFGSREALVHAVFSYRMHQMEERRGRMLAEAERKKKLHEARVLLEMVYFPQLDLLDADGKHSYASFLCQYLLRERFEEFGDFGTPLPPHLDRILKLLRVRLGYLPTAVAQRRLMGCNFMFLNILVSYSEKTRTTDRANDFESALADTLAQIEAALCMPFQAVDSGKKSQKNA